MIELADSYKKQVVIAETSYPISLLWADWTNNIVGDPEQLIHEFDAIPQGQHAFLTTLDQSIQLAQGLGWCYWGAELVAADGPPINRWVGVGKSSLMGLQQQSFTGD